MSATESQNGLRELGVITVQRIQKRSFGAQGNLAEIGQASTIPRTSKKKITIFRRLIPMFVGLGVQVHLIGLGHHSEYERRTACTT